jgi:hypothetical protein
MDPRTSSAGRVAQRPVEVANVLDEQVGRVASGEAAAMSSKLSTIRRLLPPAVPRHSSACGRFHVASMVRRLAGATMVNT